MNSTFCHKIIRGKMLPLRKKILLLLKYDENNSCDV